MTEAQKLDTALRQLDNTLRWWGVDNHLGYRTEQTLRLSADGATNLVTLITKMSAEIDKLNQERTPQ